MPPRSREQQRQPEAELEGKDNADGGDHGAAAGIRIVFPEWDFTSELAEDNAGGDQGVRADWLASHANDLDDLSDEDGAAAAGTAVKCDAAVPQPQPRAAAPQHSPQCARLGGGSGVVALPALPADILQRVCLNLPLRDTLRLGYTCRALADATADDALWSRFAAAAPLAPRCAVPGTARLAGMLASAPPATSPAAYPYPGAARLLARQAHMAAGLAARFECMRGPYLEVQALLCASWDGASVLSDNRFQVQVTKLTRFNWSLAYDAFAHALHHVASAVALQLWHLRLASHTLAEPGQRGEGVAALADQGLRCAGRGTRSFGGGGRSSDSDNSVDRGGGSSSDSDAEPLQLAMHGGGTSAGGAAGGRGGAAEAWRAVVGAWREYRSWLHALLSSSATALVGECVSAERSAEAMARGRPDTPTLFDAGRAAFRSQVVLGYRLRGALQAASLHDVLPQVRVGSSLHDQALKLLQEINVMDDGTCTAAGHTQEKLQGCFGYDPFRKRFNLHGY